MNRITGILDQLLLGSTIRQWIVALVIAVAASAVLVAIRRLLAGRLTRLADQTTNQVDDILLELVRGTHGLFLTVVGVAIGAGTLAPTTGAARAIRAVVVVALVLQAARWGTSVITRIVRLHAARIGSVDAGQVTTLNALSLLLRLALYAVLVLLALDNFGINVTTLIAGLGVGGIAVALATQNMLSDLFASLSIVLDKPFVIGDYIAVGDLGGTVEHIGLKTTRLRSLSGEQLVFANGDLLASRIRNFKRMRERRVVFSIGLAYETTPDRVAAIPGELAAIVQAQPQTRFERAHFYRFGDSSLDLEIVYWMLDPDYNLYMDTQQRINLEILRRFAETGVSIAYPTRTVYVRRAGEAAAEAR